MTGTIVLATLLLCPRLGRGEADPRIRLVPCSDRTCVAAHLPEDLAFALRAHGVTETEWREAFPVRTREAAASAPPGPGLFGDYSVDDGELLFRPRLPFLPGVDYVAALRPDVLSTLVEGEPSSIRSSEELELEFRLPVPERDPPRVVAIHPATEKVPSNLLRAYVRFSVPMRPDLASSYVRLVDDEGRNVEFPFVDVEGGLWDPDHTRLTLLFHPGRLKRGVAPREALGPPLEEGRSYRLEVDPGWPAATGEPLVAGAGRTWTVGPPDRIPVLPSGWDLRVPRVGTLEPLRVSFGEPLDHALALRLLSVSRDGEPLEGSAAVRDGGSAWRFRPSSPWSDGKHLLRVDPALEDLAGNNLRGVFDREPGGTEAEAVEAEIPFRPSGAP